MNDKVRLHESKIIELTREKTELTKQITALTKTKFTAVEQADTQKKEVANLKTKILQLETEKKNAAAAPNQLQTQLTNCQKELEAAKLETAKLEDEWGRVAAGSLLRSGMRYDGLSTVE